MLYSIFSVYYILFSGLCSVLFDFMFYSIFYVFCVLCVMSFYSIYLVFCDLFYMTPTENTLGQQIGWISRLRKQHEDCDMHWMHCLSHQATNFDGQVAIWTTGSLQRKLAVCRLGLHPAASVWRHYVTAIALHKSCAKFVWVLG